MVSEALSCTHINVINHLTKKGVVFVGGTLIQTDTNIVDETDMNINFILNTKLRYLCKHNNQLESINFFKKMQVYQYVLLFFSRIHDCDFCECILLRSSFSCSLSFIWVVCPTV